jgi:hypothetical protein
MEFLLDKLSITRSEIDFQQEEMKEEYRKLRLELRNESVLSIHEICKLVELGFQLNQIIFTIKTYKVTTLQDAAIYMTKDSLLGTYNHVFHNSENGSCKICLDNRQDLHLSVNENQINFRMDENDKSLIHQRNDHDAILMVSEKDKNKKNNDKLTLNNEDYNKLNNVSHSQNKFTVNNDPENSKIELSQLNKTNQSRKSLMDSDFFCIRKDSKESPIDKEIKIVPKTKLSETIKAEDINRLYNFTYDDPNLCEICWENEVEKESTRLCMHKFCSNCITNYLTNKINTRNVRLNIFYFILKSKF